MLSITEKQDILNLLNSELKTGKNKKTKDILESKSDLTELAKKSKPIADTIEISDKAKALKRVDDFLNLGKPDRLNTDAMTPGEKEEFLKMLALLLERGIVGYEILEVDGKPEKHFIVNQIGDDRLYGAKLYE